MTPALDALLDRADAYRRMVCQQTGAWPTRFVVTAEEWRTFLTDDASLRFVPGLSSMTLMGMTVVRQHRALWVPGAWAMTHGPLTEAQTVHPCVTQRPSAPVETYPCPCGEVLWDMPTSPAFEDFHRRWGIEERRPRLHALDDPLPPLDDLDEGRTCAHGHFPTFAACMAHWRTPRVEGGHA